MSGKQRGQPLRGEIPPPDPAIPAPSEQSPAIWGKRECPTEGLPPEKSGSSPRRQIPEPHFPITAQCQQFAIGRERQVAVNVREPGKATYLPARCDLPEPYGLIVAARGQQFPVGRERQAVDAPGVAHERPDFTLQRSIPQPNRRAPTAEGQIAAVWGERGLRDALPLSLT
jgi:hypothetical protein